MTMSTFASHDSESASLSSRWLMASLFLHLLLLLLWALIPQNFWQTTPIKPIPTPEAPAITFVLIPEVKKNDPTITKPTFIPTMPSQAVEKENPNAILESDNNTLLKSREKGLLSDSPVPQQTGSERAGLSYVQTPASRPTPETTSTPPSPQSKSQPLAQKTQNEPKKEDFKLGNEGVPLFPTPQIEKQEPAATPATNQKENKPNQTSAPMSFAREKSQIRGSSQAELGDNSPEAKSSDLGRYKAKMFRAIGSRWYLMVDQQMSMLGIGGIKIKFFVQANGVIRDIQPASQNGRTEILENISIRAIRDSGPFEPFSDQMKQQLGDGYWEEITFSIY